MKSEKGKLLASDKSSPMNASCKDFTQFISNLQRDPIFSAEMKKPNKVAGGISIFQLKIQVGKSFRWHFNFSAIVQV